MTVSVVIMAGGKGERFWPKSRESMPKQFIQLTEQGTMLQLTFDRAKKVVDEKNIFVVTGPTYSNITASQLPELPRENIIVEPEGRNTAPCIGLAAVILEHLDPTTVMIVLPADHYIADEKKFANTLNTAVELANDNKSFITLGIVPTRPETGYGYIELADRRELAGAEYFSVASFKEKPDYDTATKYLSSGNFLWNSGMFIWSVASLLQAIKVHQPEMSAGLKQIRQSLIDGSFEEVLPEVYRTLPKDSIDYAILEKVDDILVIPGNFGWDDVGSWAALPRVFDVDGEGNYIQGSVVTLGAQNCVIDGRTKLIAAVGVEDLVVIDTDDVVLICPKEKSQDVKLILKELRQKHLEKYL